MRLLGRRWALRVGTGAFRLMMAHQPDHQPLNWKELSASFSRPPEHHRPTLRVLEHLETPEKGVAGLLEVLLDRTISFDVYLMLVAERTLIVLGARDPSGVLAALHRIHREGCAWFRQSALYAGFHILDKADAAEDAWLSLYAEMARETIRESAPCWRRRTAATS